MSSWCPLQNQSGVCGGAEWRQMEESSGEDAELLTALGLSLLYLGVY